MPLPGLGCSIMTVIANMILAPHSLEWGRYVIAVHFTHRAEARKNAGPIDIRVVLTSVSVEGLFKSSE